VTYITVTLPSLPTDSAKVPATSDAATQAQAE
jgi:hypothetical protein